MTGKDPETFDVLNVALEGTNLIEAAAGTGKTYSIATMVLRWILETDNKIDSILAVTFTKYATAELKDRILNFLEKAFLCIENGDCKDGIIKKVCDAVADKNAAAAKLKAAINDFDTAPIFTIHGFCQKIIREHAFELGIGFDMKLKEDIRTDMDAATAFFRQKISSLDDELLKNKEFRNKLSRERLADFISTAGICGGTADIKFTGRPEVTARLAEIYEDLNKEALVLAKRNRNRKNIMGFDDILLILHEALQKDGDAVRQLQKIMAERYSLVLIDEFQDTDPQQYFIFKRLFCNGAHTVFFIGDPKQSIYAFRKADIFAYYKARTEVGRIYVMARNFRSSAPAVNAVNEVFDKKDIFSDDSLIKYETVKADKGPEDYFLANNTRSMKGIMVREVPEEENGKKLSKEKTQKLVTKDMIRIISLLTKPDSTFKIHEKDGKDGPERAVKLSDIAILVAKNDFALEICDDLKKAGIPATAESESTKELFTSEEALAMQKLILAAVTKGAGEFKALLLTLFYNKSVDDLAEGRSDVEALHERFLSYFKDWAETGFFAAFSKFTADKNVLRSISGKGEKTIGSLRRFAEIIHTHETEEGFSAVGTQKWFNETIISKGEKNGDKGVTADSGGKDCVRIMTLHKSKGLEFNIVFFPFFLRSSTLYEDKWMTQHTKVGNVYKRELRLIEKGQTFEQTDEDLEEIRRIYVGVTRAKYLTVCYTQEERKHLEPTDLFRREDSNFISIKKIKTEDLEREPVSEEHTETNATDLTPPEEAKREIRAGWAMTSFSGIKAKGRHKEAAGLSDEEENQDEDENRSVKVEERTGEIVPMADFPRGTDAGTVIHSIFEKADFSSCDNTEIIRNILKKKMNLSDDELEKAVLSLNECINSVRTAPIFDSGKALKDVSPDDKVPEMKFFISIGNDIARGMISKIMEENYKTPKLEDDSVRKGLLNGSIDLVAHIGGKYYIIDWKSNDLGDTFSDYDSVNIAEEMKKHNYHLQYMLYLAAFDRYMTKVDPKYSYGDFGGAIYVFLRGVKAGSTDTGVFYDRPEESELRKIQELFKGEK